MLPRHLVAGDGQILDPEPLRIPFDEPCLAAEPSDESQVLERLALAKRREYVELVLRMRRGARARGVLPRPGEGRQLVHEPKRLAQIPNPHPLLLALILRNILRRRGNKAHGPAVRRGVVVPLADVNLAHVAREVSPASKVCPDGRKLVTETKDAVLAMPGYNEVGESATDEGEGHEIGMEADVACNVVESLVGELEDGCHDGGISVCAGGGALRRAQLLIGKRKLAFSVEACPHATCLQLFVPKVLCILLPSMLVSFCRIRFE